MEATPTSDATDTCAMLQAPVTLIGSIFLESLQHGLEIDPDFVGIAVVTVGIDLDTILV